MFRFSKRALFLMAGLLPLLALFVYTVRSAGPLAPVKVTLTQVQEHSLTPALFGIGTVQARFTHKIGPTFAGRLKRLDVQVGEHVNAGQVLGQMDPIDLDERVQAQRAALESAKANLSQAKAKLDFAQTQATRYEQLRPLQAVSEEALAAKVQERDLAQAALSVAQQEISRMQAEAQALQAQRNNLELIAPVAGLVIARNVETGTTVVAGQAVVELIDPQSLWVDTRFDQISAQGLQPNLTAQIRLRSRPTELLSGKVLRVEPVADAITEEMLAKVSFATLPSPLPPLGELAEVTLELPALAPSLVLPNAAVVRYQNHLGVWKVAGEQLHFSPVTLGRQDLDGRLQILSGVSSGERVVLYSEKPLNERSRIQVQEAGAL